MEVCAFSALHAVLCVGLYGRYTHAERCDDLVVSSLSLLVEFGQPAEVNCSVSKKPESNYTLGWESKTFQPKTKNETSVVWRVESMTNWEETDGIMCFLNVGRICISNVPLTIYKIPDRVTLSSGSGVWVEGDQTELRCEIENMAPGRNLSVCWTRAGPDQHNFTHFSVTLFPDLANEKKSVKKTVSLNVTARREDDGARYQCAAVLNLNLNLSKIRSEPITITVHYKPVISGEGPSVVESKQQMINCPVEGNPSPQYTWTLPNNTIILNSSSINIQKGDTGQYTCRATNHLGNATWSVTVIPANRTLLNILLAAAGALLAILLLASLYYRRTHMGQYILKQLRNHRHNTHFMDHNAEDHSELKITTEDLMADNSTRRITSPIPPPLSCNEPALGPPAFSDCTEPCTRLAT